MGIGAKENPMNNNLKEIIRKALDELEEIAISDMSVKRSLVGFARSYNSVPQGEQRVCYDTAADEFLTELFGRDSDSFKIYWKDYLAAKCEEFEII
jgi:hypothetical protein